jgi:hypothetical protein
MLFKRYLTSTVGISLKKLGGFQLPRRNAVSDPSPPPSETYESDDDQSVQSAWNRFAGAQVPRDPGAPVVPRARKAGTSTRAILDAGALELRRSRDSSTALGDALAKAGWIDPPSKDADD